MNYRPDEDAHFVAKRRQYIKRKKNTRTVIVSILCVAIAIVWLMIILTVKKFTSDHSPSETVSDTAAITTEVPVTTAAVTEGGSFYAGAETEELEITRSDIAEGSLILVSDHLGYVLPEKKPALVTVWGNKSPTYYVASSTLQLARDAFDAADKMFSDYYAEHSNGDYQITMGYSDAETPTCCSEHGTGYAFDVNVYANGISYRLAEAGTVDPIYSWLYDNAANYGFVLRYGADKTGVTNMAYDADHFRYVGVGHSQYMTENDLSLEEYIGKLQKHRYGGEHLEFSYGGIDYEVFYVNFAENADTITIDVPKGVLFTVSGDNVGGIIVTLSK